MQPHPYSYFETRQLPLLLAALISTVTGSTWAQSVNPTPTLQIRADQVTGKVSPTLYGLMTEEINYSYDGGLYAELVRNRTFKDHPTLPVHWHLVRDAGASGAMALDSSVPLNHALTRSLKLVITKATPRGRVGVANDGYWGIPVKPNMRYRATIYAQTRQCPANHIK